MIVVLLILLWSLSACYFTRLFSRIRMKLASVACAILYTGVTGWILFVIVFGAIDPGVFADESRKALMLSWDIPKALTSFLGTAASLPPKFLAVLFLIAGLIIALGFLVVFSDCLLLIRAVCLRIKKRVPKKKALRPLRSVPSPTEPRTSVLRLRLYCRANC